MEFTIDRHTLHNALYKAQGIVDKKSSLNVLSHVLVESIGNDAVRFVSTDYDVALLSVHGCTVSEPGALAINGRYAFEVVRNLPPEPVLLKSHPNNWIHLHCGRSQFKLVGIPADDFPEQKEPQELEYISIPKSILLAMIDRTVFSISTDESRMNLNGVFMEVKPSDAPGYDISLVSTDGHRLSRVQRHIEAEGHLSSPLSAIIHRKGIVELRRILEGQADVVQFTCHRNNILFRYENSVVLVRQIDEAFPEYQKVIPVTPSLSVTVDRVSFSDAVRRTATLTTAKSSVIKLSLQPDRLVLSTTNPEHGEARDELDTVYQGRELTIGFNYRYILDVLSVLSGDTVRFSIEDEFSPGMLSSDADSGSTFVIMPIRI